MEKVNVIAVDLGASSGRVISGQFDGKQIKLKEQYRFSNHPVEINDRLNWDYLKIFQEVKRGLALTMRDLGHLDSLSVDTWGVDYGLLTKEGEVLFAPHCYRDSRTAPYEAEFAERLPAKQLFRMTGNAPDRINTNLQVFADLQRAPFLKRTVDQLLMMPSLIEYFFSGIKQNEFTIASTTGLLDVRTKNWNTKVLNRLEIPAEWFADVVIGGADLGPIRQAISEEIKVSAEMRVISGVGHDTAAALMALPLNEAERKQTAFISCGTWSIVGLQNDQPIISEVAFEMGLTNEGCFDGSNRVLKNITGLWVIQELQKEWTYTGVEISFAKMQDEAAKAYSINSFIDLADVRFAEPGQMEEKIVAFLKENHQTLPKNRGQLIRVVLESLAFSYRQVIEKLEKLTGTSLQKVHMFGGGIQNQLLVQLTADFTQRKVVTGPVEASVLGNVVAQLKVLGKITDPVKLDVLANTVDVQDFNPTEIPGLEQKYAQFMRILAANNTEGK